MSTRVETLEFQAEARQLLQLMVHSIYSNKDIFLRELISNASDALDKLRIASLVKDGPRVDSADLRIEIEADVNARTLTVRDNGIGMSRDEVVGLIGTIAKSGTAELLRKLRESEDGAASSDLIGQFGVGFYSTFMVADKVTLLTGKAGESGGTRWESDGAGTYVIETVDDAPRGTAVTVHLKPEDSEDRLYDYTDENKIREIVKRYSDFIAWPIRLVSAPAAKDRDSNDDGTAESGAGAENAGDRPLNSMKALWARPQSEVDKAEYDQFYQHLSHDWTGPLEVIHMKGEGTFEYEALLFIPSRAPLDLFTRDARRGVQLYVKRVFIMDDCAELLPNYLRFVRGVVDTHDLSLNISREILQQDRRIQLVRRRLVKKILASIRALQENDAERYRTLWKEFGAALKEGLLEDADNQDAILGLVSVDSTHDADRPTTLREYIERMKDAQNEIYYLTGDSRGMIENSPHMEAFRAKGYEVLILTDPVDEVWVERVAEFDGKPLKSIAKGEVDLDTDDEKKSSEAEREQLRKDFAALLPWLAAKLEDDVKEVRLSSRLTTSPACLVGDTFDMTPALEKMYRAMGHEMPRPKRILELNPTHALVMGLRAAHERDADSAALGDTAELLYGMALLAEGGELRDPARFTRLLAERLAEAL
ncbi:molecular chaperone of HSP90 family [Frankia casuarinae]|uniref:Chaperone protein HtpG n=2 Tax=Frankia casuarinae (strain DSM 45818 / CECT 9043 / HFP020203 / CcI3) TaxID=106370 RepID=HTPG_FRACC|nr:MULTISPECIES: molecular chaperone HtpG [Frankia]Q2JGG1.1 RecName: Full=Chaperone protein HtpG; AltName: Full=Heat shock protein HtpG; AltName: Full=High temperature protein G [Frankia casuarinae]ABD09631.1 heat shock protein Hsp90 [Frankia casuarinae]ETA03665.1 molecular chaperone of HSP90 family [Frankia sp. CcI6]EYT93664.1 molecular chaperone of HSP90 family [Frankia casuarinae]KDA43887.1 molecular chaperone of HSP90 family [Frankia sp. BMG5.23]OHV57054.1 molecular chaperone HtpG [Franki